MRSAPLLLALAACAAPRPEDRYRAVLDRRDREHLRLLLRSSDPMTRNAAARRLCDLGERDAAEALVANLHRDSRTFVATDAIWHLRALFGTDRGYDPNLGYRHQTERQKEWWDWLGRTPEDPPPGWDADLRSGRDGVRLWVRLMEEPEFEFETAHRDDLWRFLALLAKSRDPEDVALQERAFDGFVKRWPNNPDLWNNHALAALNNGNYEASEKSYRRALELVPKDPRLHNDYGILLEGLGRLDEAEREYRTACSLAPDDDVCRTNLADVLAKQGRRDEAIEAYREAERLAPEKWYYQAMAIRHDTWHAAQIAVARRLFRDGA